MLWVKEGLINLDILPILNNAHLIQIQTMIIYVQVQVTKLSDSYLMQNQIGLPAKIVLLKIHITFKLTFQN